MRKRMGVKLERLGMGVKTRKRKRRKAEEDKYYDASQTTVIVYNGIQCGTVQPSLTPRVRDQR